MAAKLPPPEDSGYDPARLYVWVKALESKINNLLREVEVLKNDFSKKNTDLKKDAKMLNADLLELKRERDKTQQKMDLVIKELKQTAGLEEVMVLRKYMEFWNPLNFVTQRDLERVVESKLALRNVEQTATSPQLTEGGSVNAKNKKA